MVHLVPHQTPLSDLPYERLAWFSSHVFSMKRKQIRKNVERMLKPYDIDESEFFAATGIDPVIRAAVSGVAVSGLMASPLPLNLNNSPCGIKFEI